MWPNTAPPFVPHLASSEIARRSAHSHRLPRLDSSDHSSTQRQSISVPFKKSALELRNSLTSSRPHSRLARSGWSHPAREIRYPLVQISRSLAHTRNRSNRHQHRYARLTCPLRLETASLSNGEPFSLDTSTGREV
jgi:hypothetical protein